MNKLPGNLANKLSVELLREVTVPELPLKAKSRSSSEDVDLWTPAILLERAAYLRQMARHGDGSASETLKEYPQHFTMLSFRSRDGEAEVHANFADLFYILEGATTLVTGGVVAGARVTGPGEIRGDAVEGGTRRLLKEGDLAHVPAGVPHQMLVAGEKTVTCFVMKIAQAEHRA